MKLLSCQFQPELLNRMDQTHLHSFSKELVVRIVELQLAHVASMLESQHISIMYTDALKQYIADIGYDPLSHVQPSEARDTRCDS